VVLGPDDALETLVDEAVARGADAVGMAGGDGSQAIVAAAAAKHGLPYVCIPAGTRNHLALDLGVDRDDVVGALDAFGPARQARVDLAAVNGRVFVNNVSLGVYAEIVASDAYRDAKVQTVSSMLPELLRESRPFELELAAPDGRAVEHPQIVMVSNNPYRVHRLSGFGTRASMNRGVLGVMALRFDNPAAVTRFVALEAANRADTFPGWEEWHVPTFRIDAPGDVNAGVDGEAVTLSPPLEFEIRPRALTVRISPRHPGISPAARRPGLGRSTFLGLARIVSGRPSGLIADGRSP
jgi:diacylglycerol kinase family enzyme